MRRQVLEVDACMAHGERCAVVRALKVSIPIALVVDCDIFAVDKLRHSAREAPQSFANARLKEMVRWHAIVHAEVVGRRTEAHR